MTSLHVICGLGPPIKNPGYAYGTEYIEIAMMQTFGPSYRFRRPLLYTDKTRPQSF